MEFEFEVDKPEGGREVGALTRLFRTPAVVRFCEVRRVHPRREGRLLSLVISLDWEYLLRKVSQAP